MPLDVAAMGQIQPALAKLNPKTWRAKLVAAAQLRRAKSAADKAAREHESLWKAAKAEILAAIGDAPGAVCGDLVVTTQTSAFLPSTITLDNGEVIQWHSVTSLLIGNVTIPATRVAKMFGGRDGSVDVSIAGA